MFFAAEHHSGAVEENQVAVNLNFLHGPGDSRRVADLRSLASFERVYNARLSDVGEAHHSDCDLGFGLGPRRTSCSRVILEELQQIVSSNGIVALQHVLQPRPSLFGHQVVLVDGHSVLQIALLFLLGSSEEDCRVFSGKMLLPHSHVSS